jgi:hypothetical protein
MFSFFKKVKDPDKILAYTKKEMEGTVFYKDHVLKWRSLTDGHGIAYNKDKNVKENNFYFEIWKAYLFYKIVDFTGNSIEDNDYMGAIQYTITLDGVKKSYFGASGLIALEVIYLELFHGIKVE